MLPEQAKGGRRPQPISCFNSGPARQAHAPLPHGARWRHHHLGAVLELSPSFRHFLLCMTQGAPAGRGGPLDVCTRFGRFRHHRALPGIVLSAEISLRIAALTASPPGMMDAMRARDDKTPVVIYSRLVYLNTGKRLSVVGERGHQQPLGTGEMALNGPARSQES